MFSTLNAVILSVISYEKVSLRQQLRLSIIIKQAQCRGQNERGKCA